MIAVAGSTGEIGGRVAQRLAECGVAQRLDDIAGLVGRPAMTLPEFLSAHPERYAQLPSLSRD